MTTSFNIDGGETTTQNNGNEHSRQECINLEYKGVLCTALRDMRKTESKVCDDDSLDIGTGLAEVKRPGPTSFSRENSKYLKCTARTRGNLKKLGNGR